MAGMGLSYHHLLQKSPRPIKNLKRPMAQFYIFHLLNVYFRLSFLVVKSWQLKYTRKYYSKLSFCKGPILFSFLNTDEVH